jgi:hypothetical protein
MTDAITLKRLAGIKMSGKALKEVLLILAERDEADDARRAQQRERTRLSRARNVTVTLQERDGNCYKNSEVLSSSSFFSESNKPEEVVVSPPLPPRADDWPSDYRVQFWTKYPNKIGKPKALAKLDKARKRGVKWAVLWPGLERYVAKTDDRPWCNPETWINQERWADEPANILNGKHKPSLSAVADELIREAKSFERAHGIGRPDDTFGGDGGGAILDLAVAEWKA